MMRPQLMHKLLNVADFIFEDMTDQMSGKDIGNLFWSFLKDKFLDDTTKKIKVVDFIYDYVLHLDNDYFKSKYDINLSAVKKSKHQLMFVSEILTKMIKHSDIPLVDY